MPPIDHFVPLVSVAPSAERREFQITVIPQNQQPQPFQSVENEPPVAGERPLFKKNCEPSLSVQRDKGRVTNIRIQCNCGQTIDLACVYEEAGKAPATKPTAPAPPESKAVAPEATTAAPPFALEPQTPKAAASKPAASKSPPPKASAAKKPSKK
jgi:hypothetical protein